MSHTSRLATGSVAVLLATPVLGQATLDPLDGFERVELAGNDEALSCLAGGEGPAVVLLHGWPQTYDEWRPILPGLAEGHAVYACDLPGIRESTNTDDDFTKAGMAEDVHAAVTSTIAGPVHLVGHDIGLTVAYAYASAFPDDVASLTVMDAPLPGTPTYAQLAADPRAWHFAFHRAPEVPERIVANDVEFYVTHFIESLWLSEDRLTAEEMAPYVEAYSDPDTLRAGFEVYRAFPQDAEDNAAKITTPLPMPVLALNGGLVPQPWMLEMMRPLATNVRGRIIEGSGHWISEEQPEALLAELTAFLDEVDP
jgi:pimeloyl-ACP methyl ester carboxylesterase